MAMQNDRNAADNDTRNAGIAHKAGDFARGIENGSAFFQNEQSLVTEVDAINSFSRRSDGSHVLSPVADT